MAISPNGAEKLTQVCTRALLFPCEHNRRERERENAVLAIVSVASKRMRNRKKKHERRFLFREYEHRSGKANVKEQGGA